MRLPDEPESKPQVNIVPLVDVVFAVLAFFILSSLYFTQSEGLPINLPSAVTGEPQAARKVNLTISAEGEIFLGDQFVPSDQLLNAVQTLIPAGQTGLVVIRADAQVPHGQVVTVMDTLRRLRGVQLAIATQPAQP
ncbi:biopolymer transporter ExbD [Pseudanabaena sp. FACHB-2040]|uniref:ExbD/TolR family protein n=1 Tax=Pseudanabaena sp. FACHB-2040 TaxID=2692859 RepID=UPI001687B761|nr:biopolymer transporter ExbD [Pseudanabaena sp. FACHB-2040]MBD2256798.1 biopolymer transporter ExbD [Pseudanabaena sp. FACHB-2040]